MPLNYNIQIEIFNVWGINFMGPFQQSQDYEDILVVVDYVSKCVEALPVELPMPRVLEGCSMK
jgi:hypothetical protein